MTSEPPAAPPAAPASPEAGVFKLGTFFFAGVGLVAAVENLVVNRPDPGFALGLMLGAGGMGAGLGALLRRYGMRNRPWTAWCVGAVLFAFASLSNMRQRQGSTTGPLTIPGIVDSSSAESVMTWMLRARASAEDEYSRAVENMSKAIHGSGGVTTESGRQLLASWVLQFETALDRFDAAIGGVRDTVRLRLAALERAKPQYGAIIAEIRDAQATEDTALEAFVRAERGTHDAMDSLSSTARLALPSLSADGRTLTLAHAEYTAQFSRWTDAVKTRGAEELVAQQRVIDANRATARRLDSLRKSIPR